MFSCLDEPIAPKDGAPDSEMAFYVRDLAYAGRDCRKGLDKVKNLLELQPDIVITDVLVEEKKERKKFLGVF